MSFNFTTESAAGFIWSAPPKPKTTDEKIAELQLQMNAVAQLAEKLEDRSINQAIEIDQLRDADEGFTAVESRLATEIAALQHRQKEDLRYTAQEWKRLDCSLICQAERINVLNTVINEVVRQNIELRDQVNKMNSAGLWKRFCAWMKKAVR